MRFPKSAELVLPESRQITVKGSSYSIQPIKKLLPSFGATSYAKAVHQLTVDAWMDAPWAIQSTGDDAKRAQEIAKWYDPQNHEKYERTASDIARVGRYCLAIGLFDFSDNISGSPETLKGYIMPSLQVVGRNYTASNNFVMAKIQGVENTIDETEKRLWRPDKIYPCSGELELSVEIDNLDERAELRLQLVRFALEAFADDDIGVRYRNVIDMYTTESDTDNNEWLKSLGAEQIDGYHNQCAYVGSQVLRMQIPDLAKLKQKL